MSGHIKESRSRKASTSGEADDTNVAERGGYEKMLAASSTHLAPAVVPDGFSFNPQTHEGRRAFWEPLFRR